MGEKKVAEWEWVQPVEIKIKFPISEEEEKKRMTRFYSVLIIRQSFIRKEYTLVFVFYRN